MGARPDPRGQARYTQARPVSGVPAGPFFVTLGCAAAALLVMMAVTFAVALKAGKHSVVDTAWGIGIAVVALVALVSSLGYGQPARRGLLAAAAVIWGLRLAAYIGYRNRHPRPALPRPAQQGQGRQERLRAAHHSTCSRP